MRSHGIIIAIDGVVGAGKTATAKRVAEHLGYRHIDTGAMYRAVTLAAILSQKIDCRGRRIAATLSGGNVDSAVFEDCLANA